MRAVILVFAALAVVAIGLISFTNRDRGRPQKPTELRVVQGSSGVVYRSQDDDFCFVVSFPSDWTERSRSSGGAGRSYHSSMMFGQTNGNLATIVQRNSNSRGVVMIDNRAFNLADGAVFRVQPKAAQDSSNPRDDSEPVVSAGRPAVEVIQLPFAPLDLSPVYVDELEAYFQSGTVEVHPMQNR